MKFRGRDLGRGTIIYGEFDEEHMSLSVYGQDVALEAVIDKFIATDKNGKKVYVGDIIEHAGVYMTASILDKYGIEHGYAVLVEARL